MAETYKVYLAPMSLTSLDEPKTGLLGEISAPARFDALYRIKGKHYELLSYCEKRKFAFATKVRYPAKPKTMRWLKCPVCGCCSFHNEEETNGSMVCECSTTFSYSLEIIDVRYHVKVEKEPTIISA